MQKLDRFKLPIDFRGRNAISVQAWWLIHASLFSWSPQALYKFRRFLLKIFGAKIGSNVLIRPSAKITYPWKVSIGHNSWIGDDVVLYSLGEIKIGNDVVVSQKSYLCTGSHDYTKTSFDIWQKPIVIEDGAWVSTDVYIGPGVTIGKGAVIGARSSVFKDMPSGMVCIGNPAKPVKPRISQKNDT